MSQIIFNNLINMQTIGTPSGDGYIVAYDLDGVIKQKDNLGNITPIAGSPGGTPSLEAVLRIGNTTGTSSLILASGSVLYTDFGLGQFHFGDNLTNGVYISTDRGLGSQSLIELNKESVKIKSTGPTNSISFGVSWDYNQNEYADIFIQDNKYYPSSVNSTDKNAIFIGTRNSSFQSGITNSVIIGGYNLQATESNTVYLGNNVNINNAFKLPTVDGSVGQVIRTDGSGQLSWQNAIASTPSLSIVLEQGNTTGAYDISIDDDRVIKSTTGNAKISLGNSASIVNIQDGLGDYIQLATSSLDVFATSSVRIGISSDDIRIFNSAIVATSSDSNKNPVLIATRNSSYTAGITNSVIIGGTDIVATQSNTVHVSNLQLQGNVLGKYTIQPSTQPGWDALSIPTKAYVDSVLGSAVTGTGTTNYIPKWSSSSSLSSTSSIIDNGFTVSVSTNMSINGVSVGRGSANISTNTVVGQGAINSVSSTGINNTAVGQLALSQNSTGKDNTAVGLGSMQLNTTGRENTAIGAFSLRENTSGEYNVAVGWYSLYQNLVGNKNVSIGHDSQRSSFSASFNTSVGNESLHKNIIGGENVAIGYQSLFNNGTGSSNVAIGNESMKNNLVGGKNVSTGWRSLFNSTGSFSTAVGAESLYQSTTASNNTALGFATLWNNTTGQNNTAVGASAGSENTIGNNNTFVGFRTGLGLTSGSNNTFLGANISAISNSTASIYISDGSGQVRIFSDSTGKVGIGTTTPNTRLDIDGDLAIRHDGVTNISGINNDFSTGSRSFLVFQNISGSPAFITGFSGGNNGKTLTLTNLGPDLIILQNQNTNSSPNNRIITGFTEVELVLFDNQTCDLIYDTIESKWRLRSSLSEGTLRGVTAGAGLTGGGTSSFIQIDMNIGSNSGLTFSGDQLIIDTNIAGPGLTFSNGQINFGSSFAGAGVTLNNGILSVTYSIVSSAMQGNGLTANGSALDVNVNSDSLEIVNDLVRLSATISGNRQFSDSVTILGDLTVSGTTSTINTANLLVKDPLILLAQTQSGSPTLDSGLMVNRGSSATQAFVWDESVGEFAVFSTSDGHTTQGNLTIITHSNFHAGQIESQTIKLTSNPNPGYILVSDSSGLGSWTNPYSIVTSTPSLTAVTNVGSTTSTDIEIVDPTKGIILKSANGTRWRVTVDNSGALTTTIVL